MGQGKQPPKGTALVRSGDSSTPDLIRVKAWELDAPPVEYYADSASARMVDETPTLFFGQKGVDDRLINAIAIAMPRTRLKDVVEAFRTVIDKISPADVSAGQARTPVALEAVSADNFRKYNASLVRGGCSAEDDAMMDFYRIGILVKEQAQQGIPSDLIVGHVRVFMSPSTMAHLFHILETKKDFA